MVTATVDGAPVAVGFGDSVGGAFTSPGSTEVWTFDVPVGGAEVFLDLTAATAGNHWELFDPAGASVFGRQRAQLATGEDQGPFLLAEGLHRLEVRPLNDTLPTYTFTLVQPETVTLPLALHTTVTGALSTPAGETRYTFSLPTPTRAMVRPSAGDTALRYTLRHESGRSVVVDGRLRGLIDSTSPQTLDAGDWTLNITATGGAAPSWSLGVFTGTESTTAVAIDDVVSATLDGPADLRRYDLHLDAPTRLYFDNLVATLDVEWRLLDADGTTLFGWRSLSTTTRDEGPWVLPAGDPHRRRGLRH